MRTVAFLSVAGLVVTFITGAMAVSSGSGSGSGLGSGGGEFNYSDIIPLVYGFGRISIKSKLCIIFYVDYPSISAYCGGGACVITWLDLSVGCEDARCSQGYIITQRGECRCICNSGYVLDEDGYSCSGEFLFLCIEGPSQA